MRAFVMSRLDYCSYLLMGLPSKSVHRLQFIQNSAAQVLTRTTTTTTTKNQTATPPKPSSVICCFQNTVQNPPLVYKTLAGLAPQHILYMLSVYIPSRSLPSQGGNLLHGARALSKTIQHLCTKGMDRSTCWSYTCTNVFMWKTLNCFCSICMLVCVYLCARMFFAVLFRFFFFFLNTLWNASVWDAVGRCYTNINIIQLSLH